MTKTAAKTTCESTSSYMAPRAHGKLTGIIRGKEMNRYEFLEIIVFTGLYWLGVSILYFGLVWIFS